jgi:hypothetical protein
MAMLDRGVRTGEDDLKRMTRRLRDGVMGDGTGVARNNNDVLGYAPLRG